LLAKGKKKKHKCILRRRRNTGGGSDTKLEPRKNKTQTRRAVPAGGDHAEKVKIGAEQACREAWGSSSPIFGKFGDWKARSKRKKEKREGAFGFAERTVRGWEKKEN